MKKKKLHVTLAILLLVMVPPYFLVFTEEGSRLADNALLWFVGGDSIELNLRELDGHYTKAQIEKVFPDQDWICKAQPSSFGDLICATTISSFNDYPARYISFYFRGDKVSAMKLGYREAYHEQLLGHLIKQLGQPSNVEDDSRVLEWRMDTGRLVIQKKLIPGEQISFLWIANPL